MVQALHHQPGEIDGGLRTAEECDLDDPPFNGRGVVVALDIVAADHVEDDLRPLSAGEGLDLGDEVFGFVVNGAIGAELDAGGGFFRRADGDDHLGAKGLGELDRHGADAG